jgi:hypothetical protein
VRPYGETMYSWRPSKRLLATIFVLLVSIQQFFVLLVPIQQLFPLYHNLQSRGITGLLDMIRLLFAQMGRGTIQWGAFTITGLLDMKRLLFAQMGRGKIQWGAFTVQLQCNFRSMDPFTPGFTVSPVQFGQTSVAFRRSATPAKRKIGPGCVPQEVGGLACQAQMHVTRSKTFWA